ncbi:MAG: hypothetical protein AAGA48_01735 [Myxococcota bacterium]
MARWPDLGMRALYLTGGASQASFWTSFERDYAARAGLPVFRWDPAAEHLTPDEAPPLNLDVQVVFHSRDRDRTTELTRFMEKERHVVLDPTVSYTSFGGIKGGPAYEIEQMLIRGGALLWLGSSDGLPRCTRTVAREVRTWPQCIAASHGACCAS